MIICSPPRCGATKYCLDLQKYTGLEFVGELNPMYITDYGNENRKAPYHETLFQPSITKDQYIEYLINSDKYIILSNQSPHLTIHNSGIVIMRRNLGNNLLSLANFLIKCRPYLNGEGIIQHLHITYQSIYGMLTYLEVHSKPIIWYEDYFKISGTTIEYLQNHKHGRAIIKSIDSLINSNDAMSMVESLYNG